MLTFLKEYSRVAIRGNIPAVNSFQYYKRWKRLVGKDPINEKLPWITFPAIDFIEKNVKPAYKVFEYGGGGSTLYFLDRVAEVVTVEHDKEWFQKLKRTIDAERNSHWNGQLVLPERTMDTRNLDRSNPADHFSGDPYFQDVTFKMYSTFICNFDDEYFDLVLIDGRARTSGLLYAAPKVKIGGYLLLDNSERKYYLLHRAELFRENYRLLLNKTAPVPYSPFFSRTSIWQRVK